MEVLPAGLWCDLVFSCLPVSDVLHFRLCTRGTALLVLQQLPRLRIVLTQRRAALEQDPDLLRIKEGLKPLCELLLSTKIYPDAFAELSTQCMMGPPLSSLRFIFMNIMQQTHNPSHLAHFSDELKRQDFSCLQSKQALGKTLKYIGEYLAVYTREEVVSMHLDARMHDFVEGFADLTLDVPDAYYSKRAEVQRLAADLRLLQRLA